MGAERQGLPVKCVAVVGEAALAFLAAEGVVAENLSEAWGALVVQAQWAGRASLSG